MQKTKLGIESEMMFWGQRPNRINTNTQNINTHIIKLWDDIGPPCDYQEEIDLIDSASEHDVIVLDICTDGGILDTAALFNRALRSTAAHTVAVIGPSCSSAGSVIALSCREFVLDNTSSLMLHTSSYGIRGKDVDILEHATFSRKSLRRLYQDVYSGLLDSSELDDVIKGTPFYFDCDELDTRLNMLQTYREEQANKSCECEECEADEQESFNILDLVEQKVEAGVDKALKKLQAKYDFVEKPKKEPKPRKAAEKKPKANQLDGTNGNGYQPLPTGKTPTPPAEE